MFSRMARQLAPLALVTLATGLGACSAELSTEDEDGAIDTSSQAMFAANPLVLQDTPSHQQAYEDLTQEWLEWAMALPWSAGPVTDPTGDRCDLGQSNQPRSTWFLAGTTGGSVTRDCDVPVTRSLFFPLINLWSTPRPDLVDTPAKLQSFIDFFTWYFPYTRDNTCHLTLRLDGEDLLPDQSTLDEELWVQILDPFPVVLDADNYTGGAGGPRPAALVAGHYALLGPLKPGDHTLELGGARCDPDTQEVYFETSAVYHLHVPH
jgi:hypothetical protein